MGKRKPWKVVFYHTSLYSSYADKLEESLKFHSIEYSRIQIQDTGSWVRNCGLKPKIIFEALKNNPDYNIVYLDSDSIVTRYPIIFDNLDCDIAAHYRNGYELLSGTLFIANNKVSRILIQNWVNKQNENPDEWDQRNLQYVLKNIKVDFTELPASYVKIQGLMSEHESVIDHCQASRKMKGQINMFTGLYPKMVGNCRTRLHNDGTFSLPRISRTNELLLDSKYGRIKGEKRWCVNLDPSFDVANLKSSFGERVYIVGKGPSLDLITDETFFDDSPIICINESAHRIASLNLSNPIYTLQQDAALKDTCVNDKSKLILSRHAICKELEGKFDYLFTPEFYGLQKNTLSVLCAIEILKSFNVSDFNLVAFDSCTHKKITYADCIGYSPDRAGDPKRFLGHRKLIEKSISPNYVIPGVHENTEEIDTPSQSFDNQPEHHELPPIQSLTDLPDK